MNNSHCVDCPLGYFKDDVGNFACSPCADNETTASTGSTLSSNCGKGRVYRWSCKKTKALPSLCLFMWICRN